MDQLIQNYCRNNFHNGESVRKVPQYKTIYSIYEIVSRMQKFWLSYRCVIPTIFEFGVKSITIAQAPVTKVTVPISNWDILTKHNFILVSS